VGAQFDPAATAKGNGQRRTDEQLAIAFAGLGIVLARLAAVEHLRCGQTFA
jgi:hypothetical protein